MDFIIKSILTLCIDKILSKWLEKFGGFEDDLEALCRFSYAQRSCHHLKELRRHIGDEPKLTDVKSTKQAFLLTRHYIGRLGSHLRAAKVLTTAGQRMHHLFENFTIKTRPSSEKFLPPPTDHLTNLDGVLKRMFRDDSEQAAQYKEALAFMDSRFDIQGTFLKEFEDPNFKARVHAELIILEFFHATRRQFVDDDRFIGCSKPACYCCYYYIKFHPGDYVTPASHGIRYTKWRPPDLVEPEDEEAGNLRRDIMNKLIDQVRSDALRHIEQRRGPSPWHPDSTTGITSSQKSGTYVIREIQSKCTPELANPTSPNSSVLTSAY
jgi:hypothetical protein